MVQSNMEAVTELTPRLEEHRVELLGYCYRMLGSPFEAEDAVQETLVRAWRHQHRFDANRASLRSWLYSIATNVCLDMLRSAQRRARPMDLSPAATGPSLGPPLPETAFVQPIPESRVLYGATDPAELAAQRESVRLAFIAALQHLRPRQRAVLILREVLCWSAEEVARLLETSVASVNSTLQRARLTLKATAVATADSVQTMTESQTLLIARYCAAFERDDIEALVLLLHEDATFSMPPFAWWLRGRDQIRRAMLAPGQACQGARLIPTAANGSPAVAQYRPTGPGGSYEAFALVVLDVADGAITDITTYLDGQRLFPLFDLPLRLAR
jgi:RNA polymerase sigma-70 factor (ECF subfamily)